MYAQCMEMTAREGRREGEGHPWKLMEEAGIVHLVWPVWAGWHCSYLWKKAESSREAGSIGDEGRARDRWDHGRYGLLEVIRIVLVQQWDARSVPAPYVHDVLCGGAGGESSSDARHLDALVGGCQAGNTGSDQQTAEVSSRLGSTDRPVTDGHNTRVGASELEVHKGLVVSGSAKREAEALEEEAGDDVERAKVRGRGD